MDGIRRAWSLSDVMIIHRSGLSVSTHLYVWNMRQNLSIFSPSCFFSFYYFHINFFFFFFVGKAIGSGIWWGDSESGRGRKGQRKQIKNGWVKWIWFLLFVSVADIGNVYRSRLKRLAAICYAILKREVVFFRIRWWDVCWVVDDISFFTRDWQWDCRSQ